VEDSVLGVVCFAVEENALCVCSMWEEVFYVLCALSGRACSRPCWVWNIRLQVLCVF